jgi:acyl carrier protein
MSFRRRNSTVAGAANAILSPASPKPPRDIHADQSMRAEQLRQTVLDTLTGVAPEIDPESLKPEVNFRDQMELDSVDYLNFVLALEKTLGIHVPEQDYPRLSSLNGCLAYLAALLGADPAS